MSSRFHGTKDFWLGALRSEGPAFRAAVTAAGPESAVPPCPDWTVHDLVGHLAMTYRWVRSHSGRGVTDPPERRPADLAAELFGAAETPWPAAVERWDEEFGQLVAALEALDPELPAWNWAPQAKKAGFWHRRMAHETSIHRIDAQLAAGRVDPIEPKLAADGISEVLDTWLPGGRRKGPTNRQGVVHLMAVDVAQEWYVRIRGEGLALLDTGTLLDTDDHHTRTLARGTASDLLLALYGRLPLDALEVVGDAVLLTALRTG
jgi:uncharacterized protein (TIGR03083 family)